MKKRRATLKNQSFMQEAVCELYTINYMQTDIANVDEQYRRQIQQLIDEYVPNKHNQTNVETRIVLRNEVPVYCTRSLVD